MENDHFIEQAKEAFKKYLRKDNEKLNYEDFKRFIIDFSKGQKDQLEEMEIKQLYKIFNYKLLWTEYLLIFFI